VFGASRNTGMIAVQLGKKMGAKVIAVSKDNWVKTDFGADCIIDDYNTELWIESKKLLKVKLLMSS
jgi:NADPH:quinone reductase-like Zn-dependent oxidoreductase